MRKRWEKSGASGWNAEAVTDAAQVLKYLPMDKAQDARNFMLSFQCGWEALRKPGKLADAGR